MDYLTRFKQGFVSFLDGAGRVFDISSSYKNNNKNEIIEFYKRTDISPEQKDAIMIKKDWENVGTDISTAIKKFEKEYIKK